MLVFFLVASSCTKEDSIMTEETLNTDAPIEFLSKNNSKGVIHHVTAGGNDACAFFGEDPGCDRNYSLTAIMMADGTVKGQFIDGWKTDNPHAGVHGEITCMFVDGNMAKVGGVIKKGYAFGMDLAGMYFFAVLKDNGTSKNDAPDQISFTFLHFVDLCEYTEFFPYESAQLAITNGQVKIK